MLRVLVDFVRGALMGMAEVVPGVSGGTIALIVGIYYTIIDSVAHLVRGLIAPLRGRGLAGMRDELAQVQWLVVVPAGIGMLTAIVAGAAVLEPLLEEYPVQIRALFFGLVVAGISVPARMVGTWVSRDLLFVLPAAAAAFVLVGLPPATVSNPSPPLIVASGALAVCALVLPGVSGSFLLLSLGMYDVTLDAVNERDFGYLAMFALGAFVGLSAFVSVLQWLLTHRARPTLLVLTGLMVGSLRALWPWQDEDRTLLAPDGDVLLALSLAVAGAALVLGLLWAEKGIARLLHDPELVDEPDVPEARSADPPPADRAGTSDRQSQPGPPSREAEGPS